MNSSLLQVQKPSRNIAESAKRNEEKVVAVVDDESDIRLLYSIALQQGGNRVAANFASGDELLKEIRSGGLKGVDVIIMDYIMKGMNGLKAAMEVRRDDSKIKIVIVTGDDNAENRIRAAGFGYRRKPLSIQDFQECLK
jgi:CheY-like chemotaxis protein